MGTYIYKETQKFNFPINHKNKIYLKDVKLLDQNLDFKRSLKPTSRIHRFHHTLSGYKWLEKGEEERYL